jgi:G:T-mismatch repair DNA endonuclease (very short patch repair protein)
MRRNKSRDAERIAALKQAGSKVLVLWECDVRGGKVEKALKRFFLQVEQ